MEIHGDMKLFRNKRTQSYSRASISSSSDTPSSPPLQTPNGIASSFEGSSDDTLSALPISTEPARLAASRSVAEIVPPTQSSDSTGLPGYAPRPAALAVPSYDDAFTRSDVEGAVLRRESISSPTGQRMIRDYFALTPSAQQETSLEEGEEDDDDPLTPRPLRPPPQPALMPLRRATLPILPRHDLHSTEEEPNGSAISPQLPLELPPPPANALPAYTPHLAHDELRLISSVHLDQNHPAAAFFSAMTSSVNRANGSAEDESQAEEMTTGGKKLKITLTRGGRRLNENGTGPIFVRLGRSGIVEGRVDVGKVDHATGLEVSVSEGVSIWELY